LPILPDGSNGIIGETVLHGVDGELSLTVADQAAAKGAYPERAFVVLIEDPNIIVPDVVSIGFIEDLELRAVEANQAFLSSDPQIAIAGLEQALNAVLRQTILRAPNGMDILGDRLVRIQAPASADQGQP